MTLHTLTFLGEVTDKNVLGSSSKISSLGHHGLLHGLHPIDDYGWPWSDKQTVDISIALPQLGKKLFKYYESLPNAMGLLLIHTKGADLLFKKVAAKKIYTFNLFQYSGVNRYHC